MSNYPAFNGLAIKDLTIEQSLLAIGPTITLAENYDAESLTEYGYFHSPGMEYEGSLTGSIGGLTGVTDISAQLVSPITSESVAFPDSWFGENADPHYMPYTISYTDLNGDYDMVEAKSYYDSFVFYTGEQTKVVSYPPMMSGQVVSYDGANIATSGKVPVGDAAVLASIIEDSALVISIPEA